MSREYFYCPHCQKPLIIKKPDAPATDAEDVTRQKTTIDEELGADNELLDVAMGDGVIIYALREYQKDRTVWRRINAIMTRFGARYIPGGDKPGHWEVSTG